MKPAGLKTTVTRSLTYHRCDIRVWFVEANLDQVYWSLNALGLHRKKEETLTLNPEENAPKEPSKTVVFKPADLRGFRNGAENRQRRGL